MGSTFGGRKDIGLDFLPCMVVKTVYDNPVCLVETMSHLCPGVFPHLRFPSLVIPGGVSVSPCGIGRPPVTFNCIEKSYRYT